MTHHDTIPAMNDFETKCGVLLIALLDMLLLVVLCAICALCISVAAGAAQVVPGAVQSPMSNVQCRRK